MEDFTDSLRASTAVQCPPSVNEKKLMRKIDLRVIPILMLILVASFLDRYVEVVINQRFIAA
jgi:hypothetical protein